MEPEPTPTYNGQASQEQDTNPFAEDTESSEQSPNESPRLADPILVRAVFDYDAVEADELSFKAGMGLKVIQILWMLYFGGKYYFWPLKKQSDKLNSVF